MIINSNQITICAQICDRNHHLAQTISSWLQWDPKEIIIFDMPLNERAYELLINFNNSKIKIYECMDFDFYNKSKAKNSSIRCAENGWILYLDCDIEITPYFPKFFELDEKCFYMDSEKKCWNMDLYMREEESKLRLMDFIYDVDDIEVFKFNVKGLLGNGLIHKKFFNDVNGFNEKLEGYGFEDYDFVKRLEYRKYKKCEPFIGIRHLYHDNKLRTKNFFIKNKNDSLVQNKIKIDINPWSLKDKQEKFECRCYIGNKYIGDKTI